MSAHPEASPQHPPARAGRGLTRRRVWLALAASVVLNLLIALLGPGRTLDPSLYYTGDQARAFLADAQERFTLAVGLALWRGTATEIWESPSHVYTGYKRNRWPSYWRAYARQRRRGLFASDVDDEQFFSTVALHPLASPISLGTVLCPVFRLDDCLIVVQGGVGLPA